MKKLITLLFVLIGLVANAQLVNDLQKLPLKDEIVKAYEKKSVVRIMGGKYQIIGLYYFVKDSTTRSVEGGVNSIWKTVWKCKCLDNEFLPDESDKVNLVDVTLKSLKTGATTKFSYYELTKLESIKFLKKKVK